MKIAPFSLKRTVTHLENAIITLSGPAIAISGIIAGIDLLTGGSMFKNIGWLSLTWAICLLLTLDFQVLMLGARAKQIYHGNKGNGKKFCEIITIILIATAISYVSVQMQSIIARSQETTTITDHKGHQHTISISINEATKDMGINPVALIWERSSLVLILIFMSGWLQDEEHRSQKENMGAGSRKPEPEETSGNQQSIDLDYMKLAQAILDLQKTQVQEEKQTDPALLTAPKPPEPPTDMDPTTTGARGNQQEAFTENNEISPDDAEKISAAYQRLQEANTILENPKPISARSLAASAKVRRTTCTKWLQIYGATQEEREPVPENGSQWETMGATPQEVGATNGHGPQNSQNIL